MNNEKLNITIQNLTINMYFNNSKNNETVYEIETNESSLQDYTWEEIDNIVKEGKHKELFKIGDTKSFRLGDETLVAQIADFDHDDKSYGIGKAGISFILKDCMNTVYNMNLSDTNVGGWSGSDMRKYLNTDIYDKLPSDLQSVIKRVNKVTSKGNKSTTVETSSDKLWLMSEQEVFGISMFSLDGEGRQYPIFTGDTSKIKKVNSSAYLYWLRSPRVSNSTYFCYVCNDGSLDSDYAFCSYDVAFGFCI